MFAALVRQDLTDFITQYENLAFLCQQAPQRATVAQHHPVEPAAGPGQDLPLRLRKL